MRKIITLFAVALFATSSMLAQYVLSFDSITAKAGFAFTSSKSSEFPHAFRIINTGNSNMYRIFKAAEGDNGPILADYNAFEVEFDYPTVWDIPAGLQFFFSTDGFGRGYYPNITSIIGESTKLTINFTAANYPNLFVDGTGAPIAVNKRFNRFGYRNAGLRDSDSPNPADYTMDVKIKQSALIKKDGTKEYFEYAGGGMWDAGHSMRLYGPKAKFTLGAEGYVAWNLSSKEVKFINIYLADALTADVASKLEFEYAEFMPIDAAKITGLSEGSTYISIDASTLEVSNFSFISIVGGIEVSVSRVELADSADPTSVRNISVVDVMPEFVNVYNIQGQLVRQSVAYSQALDNLPKGIYIVHNKKVAVIK